MAKFYRLLVFIFLISSVASVAFLPAKAETLVEEKFIITAYHPSPGGSYKELTTTGNTYLATSAGANVGIGMSVPVGLLQVGSLSAPGLFVTASGNVGIGTTNPANKLYVSGDLRVEGSISGDEPKVNPRESTEPPPLDPRVNGTLTLAIKYNGFFSGCTMLVVSGVIKTTTCGYHSE
jgi:hypothetical protein